MKELSTINSWTELVKRFSWNANQEKHIENNTLQIEAIVKSKRGWLLEQLLTILKVHWLDMHAVLADKESEKANNDVCLDFCFSLVGNIVENCKIKWNSDHIIAILKAVFEDSCSFEKK